MHAPMVHGPFAQSKPECYSLPEARENSTPLFCLSSNIPETNHPLNLFFYASLRSNSARVGGQKYKKVLLAP